MKRFWSLLVAPVLAGIACGGADHASPFTPGFPSTSGGRSGASGGEAGSLPVPLAGASTGGSIEGPGGEGGMPMGGDPQGGAGAEPNNSCPSDGKLPPDDILWTCPPPQSFQPFSSQPLATGAGWLIGMTPSELVAVWGSYGPAGSRYFLAERGALDSDFGEKVPLSLSDVPLALSPDGLRLTLVTTSGETLREATRGALGEAFGAPAEGPYELLNNKLAGASDRLISLTVSQDDLHVAYVTFDSNLGKSKLSVGARSLPTEPFGTGQELSTCETEGGENEGRHPASFSPDALTLFYYDDLRQTARAAYREALGSPFTWFVDVPAEQYVTVNADCSRAYLSAPARNAAVFGADIEE
jgi:hypothetical protein